MSESNDTQVHACSCDMDDRCDPCIGYQYRDRTKTDRYARDTCVFEEVIKELDDLQKAASKGSSEEAMLGDETKLDAVDDVRVERSGESGQAKADAIEEGEIQDDPSSAQHSRELDPSSAQHSRESPMMTKEFVGWMYDVEKRLRLLEENGSRKRRVEGEEHGQREGVCEQASKQMKGGVLKDELLQMMEEALLSCNVEIGASRMYVKKYVTQKFALPCTQYYSKRLNEVLQCGVDRQMFKFDAVTKLYTLAPAVTE